MPDFSADFVNWLPLFREKQALMSTNNNDYSSMSHADRLNAIHRLRLLRNTTGELSAHTDIQLRNNSFNKKAPFIARCIYSEFCREARERTGANLDELMNDYIAASHSFERIAKTRRAQPEFHREVLRCLLDERFAATEAAKPYRAAAESLSDVNIALYTLLILNILPSFQAKGGDVDPNMHLEHLIRLRDYFRPLYEGSRVFGFAPYLTEMYQDSVRHIRKGDLFTRLELIHFTEEIIANLENNHMPSHLLQANRYYAQYKIHPPLEQGLWVEWGRCGRNPVYWMFESLGDDFIVIRREYDRAAKRVTEVRYELILFQEAEDISFRMLRQSEVVHICQGRPIPEHSYMHGICRMDDLLHPGSIEWIFTTNCYDQFPARMVQTKDSVVEQAEREHWKTVCETGHYEYLPVERVVSFQYVYIERTSCPAESGGRKILSWYRIPREGLLLEENLMQATIVHIRHDNRDYICFVSLDWSLDVTDAEACAKARVEITDHIEVIAPIEDAADVQ